MNRALETVPAVSAAFTVPLMLTVALATVSLVVIAVIVRNARRDRGLTPASAVASGVSAVGIVMSALALSLAVGGAASATTASSTTPGSSLPSGYQLSTK
ncbi:hypothetical protein [Lacisediminihabitans changchengi]|uniref:Uncharacterized protein n=1 Tax=Lacisediminihabitans changchengi TaxID=2787634 RepID=A0A934W3J4_9MICO|nr:hypothetical protein [Lacisediminihabitans changchengi]MBK4346560.1 hypothetical protein [Lacisediminihabitans changchengi]